VTSGRGSPRPLARPQSSADVASAARPDDLAGGRRQCRTLLGAAEGLGFSERSC